MKRIFAWILSLALLLSALAGCRTEQASTAPEGPEASQNSSSPSTDTEPSSNETAPTEPTQNVDDPKGTLPEDTDPPLSDEPLFQYDPYLVTADAREYFSEREYMLYCKALESIFSYSGIIDGIESENECWRLWTFLTWEFIPMRYMMQTALVTNEPFVYENGTMTLKFLADEEACRQNYARFESRMNDGLRLLREDDSDWERIAKLYLYVSNNMTYGDPYTAYGLNADLYNCIVYKIGECADYAFYLNTLANQAGFETICGRSLGKDGFEGADHAWSMICVEGQWYHFDACWQAPLHDHERLDHFAFSTQERYDSLAHNNAWGVVGELEMFNLHRYTSDCSELPHCESTMPLGERTALYWSVFAEYYTDIGKPVPSDQIDSYIDNALSKVQDALDNGARVGIRFEVMSGILNYAVTQMILNYSPEDLQNYPQLEYDGDWCTLPWVVLTHIDPANLRDILYEIILTDIVIGQSVELVIL